MDVEEASLGLGLLALLGIFRRSFYASSDRPSLRQGLIVLAAAFGFTLIYGMAGFYILDRHFSIHFGLLEALRQTVVMFTSYSNPGLEPTSGFGRYFAGSINVIGMSTVGFALLMLIRPVLVRSPATAKEWARAEAIVQQHGRTALARATLFDDKSYFFRSEDMVTAYAVRSRGAVVLGDPIGPPDQVARAITAFQDFCARNDLTPAYASTLPDYLDAYRAAGFDVICIGYEAIVVLDKFTLEGGENKGIRYSVNRMERSGYRVEIHLPPLEDSLIQSLHEISDAWLTMQQGGEMHFSDGWFNLGLSAIVGVGEKPGDPRVEQALHTISEYISRFYNFKGLHDFKEKYHPRWEPRYMVYPGPASLPLVLTTLLRVHSGNDFLRKFLRNGSRKPDRE